MSFEVDHKLLALIVAWTAAIVSGIRVRMPKLDGGWVVALTVAAAIISSLMFLAEGIPDWARYALLGFSGAIGGVSFTDRIIDRSRKV